MVERDEDPAHAGLQPIKKKHGWPFLSGLRMFGGDHRGTHSAPNGVGQVLDRNHPR